MADQDRIETIAALEAIVGVAHPFVRSKIVPRLDPLMIEFIGQSPLVFISTRDRAGEIDISPKGDPAGFVQVDGNGNLLVPERPGNQLALGFRNIIDNGSIGLIFVAPNQRETLRVRGTATLRKDADVLAAMSVNGKPALLYTHVEVTQAFIHCGKAMIRSQLWQPESWQPASRSIGGRQLATVVGARTEDEFRASAQRLDKRYQDELY